MILCPRCQSLNYRVIGEHDSVEQEYKIFLCLDCGRQFEDECIPREFIDQNGDVPDWYPVLRDREGKRL